MKEARKDLRYLLDRGYNKSPALKLVGDRYQLDRGERLILYRSVYSSKEVETISLKSVQPSGLKGEELWIDGFNVLNTVEAALRGEPLLICDDGVLRDFSEVYGKYKISTNTQKALKLIAQALKNLSISKVKILLESQISRSGEIAAEARRILSKHGLEGIAETTKSVDSQLSKTTSIVATSDSAILLRCKKFFDLSAYIIKAMKDVTILQLR